MAWTNIPDVDVEAGGIPKGSTVTALRDNIPAVANRDAGAPKLQTDFQFLARASLSNDATVEFTAFDASKYDSYLFSFANVVPSSDTVTLNLRTSTDGGSSYDSGASDYAYVVTAADSTSGAATISSSAAAAQITICINIGSAANEDGFSGEVRIAGPHIIKRTQVFYHGSVFDSDGRVDAITGAGSRLAQADVDAVQFFFSSGNMESGIITMYGLRND